MKNNPSAQRKKRNCPPCSGKCYAHLDYPEQQNAKDSVKWHGNNGEQKTKSEAVRNRLSICKPNHSHEHGANPVPPCKPLRAAGCAGIHIGAEPVKSPVCRRLNVLCTPNWQGYNSAESHFLPCLVVNTGFDVCFSLAYALRRYADLPNVWLKTEVPEFQVTEDIDVIHAQQSRDLAQKLCAHSVSSSFRMTCIAPTAIVTSAKRMIPIISISSFFCPG